MKKTIIATLLTSSALMLFAKPGNAQIIDSDTSDVGIRFNTNEPEKPGPGPYKDNLALVWTPTKFDFGKHDPTGKVATYTNTVANSQYLAVNDDRKPVTGSKDKMYSAWKTTAKLSELTSTSGKEKLTATLQFGLSKPKAYDIGKVDPETSDFLPNHPKDHTSELPPENNIKFMTNVSLEAGSSSAMNILGKTVADNYHGGVATTVDNAKLVVTDSKGSAASGKSFKGKVTWSLDNTY